VPPPHPPLASASARRGSATAACGRERTRIAYVFPALRAVHAGSRVRRAARRAETSTSSMATEQ
jgi:hypothetical protein